MCLEEIDRLPASHRDTVDRLMPLDEAIDVIVTPRRRCIASRTTMASGSSCTPPTYPGTTPEFRFRVPE